MTTSDTTSPSEDAMALNREVQADMILNAMMSRMDMINKYMDPRRDYDKECGYIETSSITPQMYRKLYDRDPIAARVVDIMPEECWKTLPEVFEEEDPNNKTAFEDSWDQMNLSLKNGSFYKSKEGQGSVVWEYLKRLDKMSRIGSFGVLLLGLSDLSPEQPLTTPAPGFEDDSNAIEGDQSYQSDTTLPSEENVGDQEPVRLMYLRAFDESLVEVVSYENRQSHPRFGQPKIYKITFINPEEQSKGGVGLPLNTQQVHWSRVIHVADNRLSSEVFGEPSMRPVFNRLVDLTKLYGGSAEMYWKGAFPGLSLEIDPKAAADVGVDTSAIREAMWKYSNSLQRWFALTGVSAKTLSPQVVDPTQQVNIQLDAICVKLRVPKRIFMGSERGELASSQDKSSWNEVITERQQNHIIPNIIVPFIDRLVTVGVLLPPSESYSVEWNPLDLSTPTEKASYASTVAGALSTYVATGVDSLIEPIDFLTKILGLKEEDAQQIMDSRTRTLEDQRAQEDAAQQMSLEQQALAQEQSLNPSEQIEETPQEQQTEEPAQNVFCPTGEGGGVDPTCSPNRSKLSAEAEKAVDNWWKGGYEEINSNLRSGKSHPSVKGLLEAIDSSSPTSEETIVYRGMSLDPSSDAAQNMKKGYSVFDEGFMAVTSNAEVAKNFASGGDYDNLIYVVSMKVPAGTKMASIPSGLNETLLPPGKRFIIDKISKRGDIRYVEARYIQ